MGKEEMNRVKEMFSRLNLHPTYLEHEEVVTSEDVAKTRGFELKQGIKALVFTNDENKWVVVDIQADQKVDTKKVATHMNWSKSKIRMATQEGVMDKTGCQIGAVPPFSYKILIPILIDLRVYDNEQSAFNIGLRTNSVKIPTQEMSIVFKEIKAIEGDFVKV